MQSRWLKTLATVIFILLIILLFDVIRKTGHPGQLAQTPIANIYTQFQQIP